MISLVASAGTTMTTSAFQWSNGNWFTGGQAQVQSNGFSGGTGKDLALNNITVNFAFGRTVENVRLFFGEYGGNVNLTVNGDFKNFNNFADLNGIVIGGASVAVTNGLGNDQGTLMLTGEVHSFAIGGQELAVDTICYTEQPGVDATGVWIMPYGVGGTPLYRIKPTGLTDYNDGPRSMIDAPFGGHLGFRLGRANVIPTADLYYYRFQYRHESDPGWSDFSQTVRVHYQLESPGNPPVFPTLVLGPHDIAGKKLYRFQPHETELPSMVPPPPSQIPVPNYGQQQQEQEQQGDQGESGEEQSDEEADGEQSDASEGEQGEESEAAGEEGDQDGDSREGEAAGGEERQSEDFAESWSEEDAQAMEQWLRRIPDDPGGLLRQRFLLQHLRRQGRLPGGE